MEFVTTHMIGGIRGKPSTPCDVVVDHELYIERKIKDGVENISLDGMVLFIKKSAWNEKFGSIPKITSVLIFDDRKFQIEAVNDDMGILEITLGAARG